MNIARRPSKTPAGLRVVHVAYAPNHNKFLVIAKRPDGSKHSDYVVETIKKNGKWAKRQIRQLWDTQFTTVSEAKLAIRKWDMS
jgi:hypothetical protein